MQGARTTAEIFDKTTPALEITNNELSKISADAWKNAPHYLNTKHTDEIQIKHDPASGVLTFDDPFQQRTVGKPSDCMDKRSADPATKANELAAFLRSNNKEQFGVELKQLLKDLPKEELISVLKLVDEINEKDRVKNPNLPDLEIRGFNHQSDVTGTMQVIYGIMLTEPGKIFGNTWRNETVVIGTDPPAPGILYSPTGPRFKKL